MNVPATANQPAQRVAKRNVRLEPELRTIRRLPLKIGTTLAIPPTGVLVIIATYFDPG